MATVKTGIGTSKRDLLEKIGRLTKFVDAKKGEFTAKDKLVFTDGSRQHGRLAYKLLHKIPCVQLEMSLPFGYYARSGAPQPKSPPRPVMSTRLSNPRGREWTRTASCVISPSGGRLMS